MRLPNSHPTWRLDEQGNWQRTDYDRPPVVVPPQAAGTTERAYADWRRRLNANLSRSTDSHWDSLTYTVSAPPAPAGDADSTGHPPPAARDDER